jgi:uncharacterized membrane protein
MPLQQIPRSLTALTVLLAAAGLLHFARADTFVRIVPAWLPAPRLLVAVSGAALLAGAAGLCAPATRRAAGWGVLLLLAAVFPANVEMLRAARAAHAPAAWQIALAVRLPAQFLLAWWVWRVALRPLRPLGPARGPAAPA